MTYEELERAASEAGLLLNVVADIITWQEEGQKVVGKVLSTEPFTEGQFEADCLRYNILTDDGPVSLVLGSATDRALAKLDVQGKIVSITYLGKKLLPDNRQVNRFRVAIVPPAKEGK